MYVGRYYITGTVYCSNEWQHFPELRQHTYAVDVSFLSHLQLLAVVNVYKKKAVSENVNFLISPIFCFSMSIFWLSIVTCSTRWTKATSLINNKLSD